jgi:hypothetical protein
MNNTWVEITGQPVLEFDVENLDSWNRLLGRWQYAKHKKEFLKLGQDFGEGMKGLLDEWQQDLVMVDRALILVKVYPPRETEVSDIHNICIKAFLDGLRDAKIFIDDEWAYIPLVIYMWAGIHPEGRRITTIEVHELGGVIINGEAQLMPCGRQRND